MHAFAEKRIEASVRIFTLAPLTQRDSSLGQALEDKEVEMSFFGEFHRGLNPISGETRSRADSDLLHLRPPKRTLLQRYDMKQDGRDRHYDGRPKQKRACKTLMRAQFNIT
jgi:hypothetical protein